MNAIEISQVITTQMCTHYYATRIQTGINTEGIAELSP